MNAKVRRFALEWLLDQNATQAAIRAGYSKKSARQQGARLRASPEVAAFLREHVEKKEKQLVLTGERLDRELACVAFIDPARLMNPETGAVLALKAMPEEVRRAVQSVKVTEMWTGKGDDRELVGQVSEVRLAPKVDAIRLGYERLALLSIEVRLTALEEKRRRAT